MIKNILAILLLVSVSGCGSHSIRGFKKSELSGVKGGKTEIAFEDHKIQQMLLKYSELGSASKNTKQITIKQEDIDHIINVCDIQDKTMVSPAAIPIIASVGKLIFDLYMDKKMSNIESLKKAAQSSYSARAFMSNSTFREQNCVAIARYSEKAKGNYELGLIYVASIKPPRFKNGDMSTSEVENNTSKSGKSPSSSTTNNIIYKQPEVFVITPIYARAANAAALTKESGSKDGRKSLPKINLSLAVSLKGMVPDKTGHFTFKSLGEGVVSTTNVELGEQGKAYKCNSDQEGCPTSDLIAYPIEDINPLSVTFNITETGNTGINFKERSAELKAIKDAMGPAIKDSLKEYFKDD